MKTAIYLRKSRSEEITDTTEETLQKHKETLLKYASQNNLTIAAIYEEVISGESLYSRPQMLMLLENIEKGLYEAILCMDIDRLGRGAMSDQGIILETLKNGNVKIITPRKIYDLNNELDEEYTEFETFMARRELKIIKRRMQRGKKKTVEDGGYVANPPYGYTRAYVDKKPSLEVNEKEAHFVRLAFDMYANQNLGAQIIADTLSSLGAIPHRGKKFSRNSIRFMLKNPVYIGKIVWNTHRKSHKCNAVNCQLPNPESSIISTNGLHQAIIDEATFIRAQEIREGKVKPPYNNGVLKNPLSGLIICQECGLHLRMVPYKKGIDTKGLLCSTKGCVKATSFERIEKAILLGIGKKIDDIKLNLEFNPTNELQNLYTTLQVINKELDTIEHQKNKLHDLLEQGIYDTDTFNKRLVLLSDRHHNLNSSMDNITNKIRIHSGIDNNKIRKVVNILEAYYYSNVKRKNELLKSIIAKIVYFKDKEWAPDQFELKIYLKDIGLTS